MVVAGTGLTDNACAEQSVRDVGLIMTGPGLTIRPKAIETPTLRKRRKDRMKGKLEPLVRFGASGVFSEHAWGAAKAE